MKDFEFLSMMTAHGPGDRPNFGAGKEHCALLVRELSAGKAVTISFPIPGTGHDIYRHVTIMPDGGVLIEEIPQARGHHTNLDGDEFYVTGKANAPFLVGPPVEDERRNYHRPDPSTVKLTW